MSFEQWEALASFAYSSIRYYFDDKHTINTYLKELTTKVSYAIGEIRRIKHDETLEIEVKLSEIRDHCRKIAELKCNLFDQDNEPVYYIPDSLPISGDKSQEVVAAGRLFGSINRLEKIFEEELSSLKDPVNNWNIPTSKQRKRIASRGSFELVNKDINLRAAFKCLSEGEQQFVISKYDDFELVFSGNPVITKVIWKNLNALHYFIDRVHGKGVKKANEGKWVRTSRCFQVLDNANIPKDFTPKQIKDRDDIASSTTVLLDKAIAHFEK